MFNVSRLLTIFTLLISMTGCFMSCTPEKPIIDFDALTEEAKRLPENAISSMNVAEGLNLNLFTSEPTIMNPTNMAIDAKGRIWVCEGRNYRLFANPNNPYDKKGDRILILEDTNGDGKADKTTVFYQGEDINSALGITVLGNKVIVSVSPNVFVFTDEDGDDVPDSKEIMFSGLEGEDHDHGIHAFVFGPDGRLYFNHGNNGKQLMDKAGNPIIDIHGIEVNASGNPYREGMAFRCEPDGSNVEVLGNNFRNPYELVVDSYGGLWQSDNDDDGNRGVRINFLMEYGNYGYKDKLSGANWRELRTGWHDEIPKRHWHLNDPGTVPNLLQTGSGSPTGMIIYEGDMLPDLYKNQLIHTEPGHGVVRSYIVSDDGAGYSASIENILTSKDDWFRPDDVAVAPDGSLFVSDWYDGGVGGHKAEDVARGRVYHISTQEGYNPTKFDFSSGEGAAIGILSNNMDVFYQSWQKLHSLGEEAEPLLANLIEKGGVAKARALWLGARIPSQAAKYIDLALSDQDAKYRMQGIKMARYVAADQLEVYLAKVVKDESAQVRREVAIALKHLGTDGAAKLWAQLANQHTAGDRWSLEAIGIGADKHSDLYFNAWKTEAGDNWNNAVGAEIVWRVGAAATVPLMIDLIKDDGVATAKLPSYFRALQFKEHDKKDAMLLSLLTIKHPQSQKIKAYSIGQLDEQFVNSSKSNIQLVKSVLPEIEGTGEWLMAIKNLGLKNQGEALLNMMATDVDLSIKKAAVKLLIELGEEKAIQSYLESNITESSKMEVIGLLGSVGDKFSIDALEEIIVEKNYSYPLTRKAVESLGNSWNGQRLLFDLLEAQELPEEHKRTAVLKLMNSWQSDIQAGVIKYLDSGENDNLDIVAMEERTGDAIAGKSVFTTYCSACHLGGDTGVDFGPSLSDIGNKLSKRSLYSAIIYPSDGINFGYEGYNILMKDGSSYSGYILTRAEDDITIKIMGASTKELALADIDKLEAMDKSLMTEGLHKVMKEKELVDLVEYLGTLKVEEQN